MEKSWNVIMKFVSDPVCHCDHLFYDKNDKLKNSYSTHFGIGFSKKRIKIDNYYAV